MKKTILTLTCLVLMTACDQPVDRLAYDGSDASLGSGSGDAPPVDACWLSGDELSVFVGRLLETPDVELPIDHCPEPMYHGGWAEVSIEVIDVAAGNSPRSSDAFHFVETSEIRFDRFEAGDEFLIAARYWSDTSAWIVVETVGVEINPPGNELPAGDNAASLAPPVDLPTDWATLVSELQQARDSECAPKDLAGTYADDEFEDQFVLDGQDSYDRHCSGYLPPDPDNGDPDSTDTL